jgi:hypothetical protein
MIKTQQQGTLIRQIVPHEKFGNFTAVIDTVLD